MYEAQQECTKLLKELAAARGAHAGLARLRLGARGDDHRAGE